MFNAGLDEAALLAYVGSAPPITLKADDVIYLHDHGVSTTVITTMLQHHGHIETQQAPAQAQPPMVPPAAYQAAQPAYVAAPDTYPYPYYSYPYYDSYYPYYYPYSSVVIGGSFWFGNPFFHHGFHNDFHHGFNTVPVHHGGFQTFPHTTVVHSGGSGIHTVGVTSGGFHTASVSHGSFHGGGGGGHHH